MKKQIVFVFLLGIIMQGCAKGLSTDQILKGAQTQLGGELVADIIFGYRPNGGRDESRHLRNGEQLYSGDFFKIQFTPKQECYVYIFQYDASHQLFTLFPTKDFRGADPANDNPVQASRTYFVPGNSKSFVLDNQVGEETIHFLVSQKPKPELVTLYNQLLDYRRQGNTPKIQVVQKKIDGYIKKGIQPVLRDENAAAVKQDSEKTFTHDQMQRLECGVGTYCVHSITFYHQ
jgi:hypothetical protein